MVLCELFGHKWIKEVMISHYAGDYIYCKAVTSYGCERCSSITFRTDKFPIEIVGMED